MGKKTTYKILAGILAVVVLAMGAALMGWIPTTPAANVNTGSTGTTTTVTTSGSTGLKGGDLVTVNVNAVDALTGGAYAEATNTKSVWLEKTNAGNFVIQTTGTAKTIKTSNDGKIWADFETQAAGQTYIFSPKYTAIAEGTFDNDCTYIDIEADGTREWVCSFNTNGLTPQSLNFGVIPTRNFNTKWLDYTAATISSPADITSIGTTTNTAKYITWTLTDTAGDVLTVSRIQLKFNSTADSKWSQGDMYVKFTNIGLTISLNDFRKWQDGTNTWYECLVGPGGNCQGGGYTLDKAYVLEYPVNGPGTQPVEVKFSWNLASGNIIATTLLVDATNEVDGAATQLTDLVNNSA